MILTLIDLSIATTCLACKRRTIVGLNTYIIGTTVIDVEKEPTIKYLRIELKNMSELSEEVH